MYIVHTTYLLMKRYRGPKKLRICVLDLISSQIMRLADPPRRRHCMIHLFSTETLHERFLRKASENFVESKI